MRSATRSWSGRSPSMTRRTPAMSCIRDRCMVDWRRSFSMMVEVVLSREVPWSPSARSAWTTSSLAFSWDRRTCSRSRRSSTDGVSVSRRRRPSLSTWEPESLFTARSLQPGVVTRAAAFRPGSPSPAGAAGQSSALGRPLRRHGGEGGRAVDVEVDQVFPRKRSPTPSRRLERTSTFVGRAAAGQQN